MVIKRDNITYEDLKDNLTVVDDNVTCGCGKPAMRLTLHADYASKSISSFVCACGNQIAVTITREMV